MTEPIHSRANDHTASHTKHTTKYKLLLLPALCGALLTTGLITGCHSNGSDSSANTKATNSTTTPTTNPKTNPTTKKTNDYTDGLKLLAYNVYLMNPMLPSSSWQQEKRADYIAQSEVIKGHDVVILNELFDDSSSDKLLSQLKASYPYQTPILARDYSQEEKDKGMAGTNPKWDKSLGNTAKTGFEDGGVAIISRYPIKEQIEYVYRDGCGTDNFAKKGFVYVRIDKNGADYHIIGTHAQSEDENCNKGEPASVRKNQFSELQNFLASRNIPADKVVFIGGDFNVIKDSKEYPDMLATLQVNAPDVYAGFATSWDPESNGIAGSNYPDLKREYLDYIFVSKNHAQPSYWHNQAIDETSPRWQNEDHYYEELSDHYPIAGFAYADKNTRTNSYRFINRPYADIKLHTDNGMYLKVNNNDKYINAGQLSLTGSSGDPTTSFNMDNWSPKNQAFCIKNNDYIQLQSNLENRGYWNLQELGKVDTDKTIEQGSENLRIQILDDDGDCLKNGDKILLTDKNKLTGEKGYLQTPTNNPQGSLEWSATKASNQSSSIQPFIVEMTEGKRDDWKDKLKYKP